MSWCTTLELMWQNRPFVNSCINLASRDRNDCSTDRLPYSRTICYRRVRVQPEYACVFGWNRCWQTKHIKKIRIQLEGYSSKEPKTTSEGSALISCCNYVYMWHSWLPHCWRVCGWRHSLWFYPKISDRYTNALQWNESKQWLFWTIAPLTMYRKLQKALTTSVLLCTSCHHTHQTIIHWVSFLQA